MKTKVVLPLTVGVIITLSAFSQTKEVAKPSQTTVPDISDALAKEVAVAQRNFLVAQTQFNNAQKEMQEVSLKADTACKKVDKLFDPSTIVCVSKPAPAK